jgi:hypothetical protein
LSHQRLPLPVFGVLEVEYSLRELGGGTGEVCESRGIADITGKRAGPLQ